MGEGLKLLSGGLHFVHVGTSGFIAASEDLFNGSPATDIVNMENFTEVVFIVSKVAGGTGTATATMESCDTVVPGTATEINFWYRACTTPDVWGAITAAVAATGVPITAGADQQWLFGVRSEGLSGTDKYVRLKLTETESTAVDGSVACIMAGGRFVREITPVTVLV
ncbi:hypothetical protein LCGC14_0893890 [marine sediment metagenome]|uniref:Uncharacterized protein n=1 Tax=marine sediment metagenome TaxID=412755 RepID=A0A0F9PJ42_9ZZZZ